MSKLAAVKDVNDVVAFEREPVTIDGQATVASAGDVTELAKVANLAVTRGTLADLASSSGDGSGTIAVVDTGEGATPDIGGTVQRHRQSRQGRRAPVRPVLKPPRTPLRPAASSTPDLRVLVGDVAPTLTFVDVASGAQGKTKDAIQTSPTNAPTSPRRNAVGKLIGTVFSS